MDMKLLEQMLQESSNEAQEHQERKRELREEMRQYLDYLEQQKKDSARMVAELDAIMTAEVEKQWEKRLQQWRQERAARKKLMEEVMEGRRAQIQYKCEWWLYKLVIVAALCSAVALIDEEKRERQREEQEIQASIIKHCELEQQQKQAMKQTNLLLQQHQLQQIDFKQKLKQVEKDKLKKEIALNEVMSHFAVVYLHSICCACFRRQNGCTKREWLLY